MNYFDIGIDILLRLQNFCIRYFNLKKKYRNSKSFRILKFFDIIVIEKLNNNLHKYLVGIIVMI